MSRENALKLIGEYWPQIINKPIGEGTEILATEYELWEYEPDCYQVLVIGYNKLDAAKWKRFLVNLILEKNIKFNRDEYGLS